MKANNQDNKLPTSYAFLPSSSHHLPQTAQTRLTLPSLKVCRILIPSSHTATRPVTRSTKHSSNTIALTEVPLLLHSSQSIDILLFETVTTPIHQKEHYSIPLLRDYNDSVLLDGRVRQKVYNTSARGIRIPLLTWLTQCVSQQDGNASSRPSAIIMSSCSS